MKPSAVFSAALAAGAASFFALQSRAARGTCKTPPDYLLILGCRVRGDVPEPMLRLRAEAAADYLNAHPSVTAVCCGGIVHDDQTKSEAFAIREILVANGVSDARILLEDKSRTTFQNFVNAKRIIETHASTAAPSVAFLSSEFHLMRAGLIGALAGVRAPSIPAPSPKEERLKNDLREFAVFPLLLFEYVKQKGANPSDGERPDEIL